MTSLELLAPARNIEIGIAAIDCGADAVYIAGPGWGNRKDAGNCIADIASLCAYAHRFGVKIFLTVNTIVYDEELTQVHTLMAEAQEAGVDAFIIRDERLLGWEDITVPMHASTQCAIRDVERARHFDRAGCARIILERELPLSVVREICRSVSCKVEFFVHGALCVCYSGDCRLSEVIDGRSADRGECIQACRSLYDLVDADGKVIVRNKALLSLKDLNLRDRLEELAQAGVSSFKIEGRLKNESYVRNVVREYDIALNALVSNRPDLYRRSSWGRVTGGFDPDSNKTFNRGYTQLWLDGKRGKWSSMDAPKSMGEQIGTVADIRSLDSQTVQVIVRPLRPGLKLSNGDGFAFVDRSGVAGFRSDVCDGMRIVCKPVPGLRKGISLFRNIDTAFEKTLGSRRPRREIPVSLSIRVHGDFKIDITARTEDGREVFSAFACDCEAALNAERAAAMMREQMGKRTDVYAFTLDNLDVDTPAGRLPLLSAATINSMRRLVAEDISSLPWKPDQRVRPDGTEPPQIFSPHPELMRTKYCVRYELGMCPVHQGARPSGPLFLLNNGRRLALHFDCASCEMTVAQQ